MEAWNMKIPLLDLKAQYKEIKDDIEIAVQEVFVSQNFILGPKVQVCEEAISRYCNSAHAVGVSSGSDALLISLLCEGVGMGDEVITTPYTFFATIGAITRLGATPVFVDIDPGTYNLNVTQIESKITSATRAIIPVHLYGQMADMDPVMELSAAHNLVVIEDAAQAIGAEYKGQRAGSIGHYGCFSFFPSKNLGGAGDGGIVTTQCPKRAEKLSVFRNHGSKPKYHHKYVGGNFRLDALQAAIILVKLNYLDKWTSARQDNAAYYHNCLSSMGVANDKLNLPQLPTDRHVLNQYVIRSTFRNALREYLNEKGIGTEIYYPVPAHLQECYTYLGHAEGAYPESEKAAKETLALPIYPELTHTQIQYICDAIHSFYNSI